MRCFMRESKYFDLTNLYWMMSFNEQGVPTVSLVYEKEFDDKNVEYVDIKTKQIVDVDATNVELRQFAYNSIYQNSKKECSIFTIIPALYFDYKEKPLQLRPKGFYGKQRRFNFELFEKTYEQKMAEAHKANTYVGEVYTNNRNCSPPIYIDRDYTGDPKQVKYQLISIFKKPPTQEEIDRTKVCMKQATLEKCIDAMNADIIKTCTKIDKELEQERKIREEYESSRQK